MIKKLLHERDVVKRLFKECKSLDQEFTYRRIKFEARKGAPDLLLLFPSWGLSYFAETKKPVRHHLSAHQEKEIELLRESGQSVKVISDESDILGFIAHLELQMTSVLGVRS